jgi:tripartite-type tricarboxylate transporter receptor subunit TctC
MPRSPFTCRTILFIAATLGLTPCAFAQEKYPARPIEMIIPTAPGGGTDIALRMLAELVEPKLGQRIAIINKTGGSGAVGMNAITQGKPDGYTIGGLWNAPLTMVPHILPTPYQPTDYATVSLVTWAPLLLCTKKDFPANDGKELIEAIRSNPGKYSYGNDGVGATVHLAMERIFGKLGVKAKAVPFAGAGETLKAFLGDHIDMYGGSIAPIQPYLKNSSAKCLIVTSAERNPVLPQASSLADLGVPNESTVLWRGIIAPKAVPAERLAVLETAFAEAASSARFREFMESRGEEARGTSGADLRKLIDNEFAAHAQIMKDVGLNKK